MQRWCVLAIVAGFAAAADRVPIVVSDGAAPLERFAGEELARYLARIYPGTAFPVAAVSPAAGARILVGTPRGSREIGREVRADGLRAPESFTVSHSGRTGVVAGADPRGALYGVYALLEKLGCGFYLSYDALPAPRAAFGFEEWDLSDAPLFADRMVFDWHNFLSSASSWDLEDWRRYVDQSAKMRFNTLMVHAYGNNPMFAFRHNGEWKPVGYLATTQRGRDWGTQHVNDVRRLIGGELFDAPVFGSAAAKAPEERRIEAAMGLMQQVFAHAAARGIGVTFALDVDTESANPQNIVRTLPPAARFRKDGFELANPDTPEGFAFYRDQTRQLLEAYPQITRLAVWFRRERTPWRNLKFEELPPAWQAEFDALRKRDPVLATDRDAPSTFAIAKLVRAFGRALGELGRSDVALATGSWRFDFVGLADRLMPPEAAIIPLDWSTEFDTEGARQKLAVRPGRKLVPIVWAHHDDRTYIGRSYMPYPAFASLLRANGGAGFGIIHWTTRPLDLYFKSLSAQVWKATENEPLPAACDKMAARTFGPAAARAGAAYLLRWVREAPMFGRETTDRFMDTPLQEPDAIIARCRARLQLLEGIDGAALEPDGRERLAYYRGYERFMLAFFESHAAWERAEALRAKGAVEESRREAERCRAEEAVRAYADAVRRGGASRGEQALLISLNLRWLPYAVSLRQALALEPVRIRFAPTQHEPLAQGAGTNTFWFDERRQLWKTLGEHETGATVAESGIRLSRPLTLRVGPIAGGQLAPGPYVLELTVSDAGGGGELEIQAAGAEPQRVATARPVQIRVPVAAAGGGVEVRLVPLAGTPVIGDAVLNPR